MRRVVIAEDTYTLDEKGVWHGRKPLVTYLNALTPIALLDYGPASGELAATILQYVVEQLDPTYWIDDTPPSITEPGIVY